MIRRLPVVFLLLLIGLLGASFPIFFNKDGISLIVIGFGFALLHLNNKIQEGQVDTRGSKSLGILSAAVTLISLAAIAYNVYKFKTTFNIVLLAGFIVLMIFNTIFTFSLLNSKKK